MQGTKIGENMAIKHIISNLYFLLIFFVLFLHFNLLKLFKPLKTVI